MIQVLTYSGTEKSFCGENVEVRRIHDALSFDTFDINIINLQDPKLWEDKEEGCSINSKNDFINVSQWIKTSNKSQIIILFPQNHLFKFCMIGQTYTKKCEIKDMLETIQNKILAGMFPLIINLKFFYENCKTKLGDANYSSAFSIQNIREEDILTKSIGSDCTTTAKIGKVILSTLLLNTYEDIMRFVKELHLIQEKEEPPEWMQDVRKFDDNVQLDIIQEKERIISEQKSDIDKAKAVLLKNKRYKSVLYETGNQLVNVVCDMLQEMTGCDLKDFVDKKNEDFRFEVDNYIFIGEVKGISTNVKKENVSQLERHVQVYLDDHEQDVGKIVALLIINHQREKPPEEREAVPESQIDLAKKYGSLIIETTTLLMLFEQYWGGEINRKRCIEILSNEKGILAL